MPGLTNLKAIGLNTQPNGLSKPEGSLETASNVVIQRDNVIEPRRGFKLFGDAFPSSTDRAKQLIVYKNRILRHYSTTLQYDSDGSGSFEDFSGTYEETGTDLRIKSIEQNSNLYFTTAEGIKKISAVSASDFTTAANYITNAGGVKALDLTAELSTTYGSTTGFLPQDSTVAYRVLWATKDANNNLIAGTPSQSTEVYNYMIKTLLQDYAYLLNALDRVTTTTTSAFISYGTYVTDYGLSNSATASQLATQLTALATEIDEDILYAADSPTNEPLNIDTAATTLTNNVLTIYVGKKASGTATIVNYAGLTGDTVTVNGTVLTEGVDWTAATSNDATATSLASAINALANVSASAVGAVVTIIADSYGTSGNSIGLSTSGGADLTVSGANLTGGEGGDAAAYLSAGDKIYLTGFSPATGTLNGIQTVASISYPTSTTIAIVCNVTATSPITYSTPKIESGTYRNITAIGTIDTPTPNEQLVEIQDYMSAIITGLQAEPSTVISSQNQTDYIVPLSTTTTSDVTLTITIPEAITTDYFYQLYRSDIAQATDTIALDDLLPNDEMQLVYEAYPTDAEITAGEIIVTDITPDAFRGANLYTNEASGEGILQANDIPPFAKDINTFKGVTFYANCRTRYRLGLNILGVEDLLTEYDAGRTPQITISNEERSVTYNFVKGVKEVTDVILPAVASLNSSGTASYITFYSANDETQYYIWFNVGTATDPAISGATGIEVDCTGLTTANELRDAVVSNASKYINDFTLGTDAFVTGKITITNVNYGYTTDASASDTGNNITVTVTTSGQGERSSTNTVLLSDEISPSIAVDETARSLVRVINKNDDDIVYAYYVSGANTVPGQMQLESRTLSTEPFYVQSNNSTVGENFNPDISPILAITDITEAFPTEITISSHGLIDGDKVFITNTDASCVLTFVDGDVSVVNNTVTETDHGLYTGEIVTLTTSGTLPTGLSTGTNYYIISVDEDTFKFATSLDNALAGTAVDITAASGGGTHTVTASSALDGIFEVTRTGANTFTIPVRITNDGTGAGTGNASNIVDVSVSENNNKANRIYYSKYNQPEAVPQLNFYDVGASDKEILRIFPLRDSLFVFKEDGMYRISGESIPFSLALADSSVILMAPDSVATLDNNLYAFTQKGITSISEAGANTVSRPIDTNLLKLQTYTNFKTITWATSYESDNSYLVWTMKKTSDTVATICYRYSILTNSWTTYDKSNTCGVINSDDDKLYLGAGDTNSIEQERKSFTRIDHADREYSTTLALNNYNDDILQFNSVTNFAEGDVLEQSQPVSVYKYNALLKKLDLDSGPTDNDYFDSLEIEGGVNMRTALVSLVSKLEADANVSHINFATTAVDTGTDVITINSHGYYTGMRVRFSSTSALPGGLSTSTDYYIIKLTNNTFQVAASLADANAGTYIDITTVGSGTHTVLSKDLSFKTETKSGNISAVSTGTSTLEITTSSSHGLTTGRIVVIDSTSPDIDGEYEITVTAHNKFTIQAAATLAGTTGTYATDVEEFTDIKTCYNYIIGRLNENDGLIYGNYETSTEDTSLEAVILSVNRSAKTVTLNKTLNFIVGPMTVYKAIPTEIRYSPVTGGDPQAMKHIGEASIMFESRTFTTGTISFSSDLLPAFVDVDFTLDGNGIFGGGSFGDEWFGGVSNAAPMRTYVPRNAQRHRYLNIKFTHSVARENYYIFGITLFGSVVSTRAYR